MGNYPANSCITFIQCWTNVEDVGPTLYTYYTNVLCLLGEHQDLQMFGLILKKMSNFHPLEVVDRCSETHLMYSI